MRKVKKNLKKIRKWPEALPVILLLKVLFPIWVHFSHLGSFFPIWVYFSTLGPLFPIWVHFSHVGRFSHLTPSPMWALSQVGALPCGCSPMWALSHVGALPCGRSPMWVLSHVGALPSGRSPMWALSHLGFPIWVRFSQLGPTQLE